MIVSATVVVIVVTVTAIVIVTVAVAVTVVVTVVVTLAAAMALVSVHVGVPAARRRAWKRELENIDSDNSAEMDTVPQRATTVSLAMVLAVAG